MSGEIWCLLSVLLWSWERSLEPLDRVLGAVCEAGIEVLVQDGEDLLCSTEAAGSAWGSVGLCCPRAPDGLSSLLAPKQH